MRAKFTTDDIAAAALAIVDESGLAALSMRSLATALGTGPMTMYTLRRYGIPLPQVARTEDASSGPDLEALRAAMADAVTFYHHMLVDTAEGKGALAYLEGRGVTRQTMRRFQLGYSPCSATLRR